ncbi:MAG TPA: tagaturonate epimerase family protein [Thermoleophilia bacterium]|nr:tagaturonate epimerase family protein [Thermoleophilia bacterium]
MGADTRGLGKYSLGIGDRFAREAEAQLGAFVEAALLGVDVTPVWNKSHREHVVVGSEPTSVREAADAAVRALGWQAVYFVDADHITAATAGRFLDPCDFFTLDVASSIGRPAAAGAVDAFCRRHGELVASVEVAGIDAPVVMSRRTTELAARRYLEAVTAAGQLYRVIAAHRGTGTFLTEISMDETDAPQTPAELLVILAALADEGIPLRTIAPRFSGRFNKGVDYVGDVTGFAAEFSADIAVVRHAVGAYGLPDDLKLSVHSGSDKFSIFPAIRDAVRRAGVGVHVKTSGTTWLEEVIGLAEDGGEGLALVQDVYVGAYERLEELCAPYASVIDIDPACLPTPVEVRRWSSAHFVSTVRHDPRDPAYDRQVRQLMHVGYKIAAEMGDRYTELLLACRTSIARNVTGNLLERHLRPLFIDD